MSNEKILSRIKKMLALGNDAAATEAERDTALRMAYNLMAKYNLSLAELPADQNDEAREEQNVIVSADKWARSLSSAVAKLFFCEYYFCRTQSAGRDEHFFVGRQSNVVTAMHMAEYLVKSLKREATKRYRSPTSPDGRSFCVGAVNIIRRRVDEMLNKGVDDAAPGNALVLANLHQQESDANNTWMQERGIVLHTAKPKQDNSLRANAYYDGRSYGKTVSLNQQVTSTATNRVQIGN